MGMNLDQVYTANPSASIQDTDIFYLIRSPYGITNDSGTLASTIRTYLGGTFVSGPASATDNALSRFDSTTGKLIQNSNVILSDAGAMVFASGQSINLPGASFINANSFNGSAIQFTAGDGTNAIVLESGQTAALTVTDGSAPSGYFDINTTLQKFNFRVPVNAYAALNMQGTAISSLLDPVNPQDAVTKAYTAQFVVGPSSATDNALCRFDSTTGKIIQNSTATLTDSGIILCTSVVASDTVNALSSLVSSGNLVIAGGVSSNITTTTTTPYNMFVTDYILNVNVAGAASIILPTAVVNRTCIVKDSSGSAATNNITVSGSPKTIDGALNYVINKNSGAACFVYNGIEWNVDSSHNNTISGAALTKTDDTNVTLTLGGSPTTALLNAASLTLGWSGTLSGTRGGTGVNNGASTFTIGGNVAFSGAFTFAGTLTANTAVTFPISGTLATTQGMPMTVISGTTQAAAVNNSYVSNNAGLVTITLPSTAAVGDTIQVGGLGAGGWKVAQNASQLINIGSSVTTTGTGGSLASTNKSDSITYIRCVVANTTFTCYGVQGNITVV